MTTPALVIGHSSDRLHPLGDAARLSAQMPNTRFARGPLDLRAAAAPAAADRRDPAFLDEVYDTGHDVEAPPWTTRRGDACGPLDQSSGRGRARPRFTSARDCFSANRRSLAPLVGAVGRRGRGACGAPPPAGSTSRSRRPGGCGPGIAPRRRSARTTGPRRSRSPGSLARARLPGGRRRSAPRPGCWTGSRADPPGRPRWWPATRSRRSGSKRATDPQRTGGRPAPDGRAFGRGLGHRSSVRTGRPTMGGSDGAGTVRPWNIATSAGAGCGLGHLLRELDHPRRPGRRGGGERVRAAPRRRDHHVRHRRRLRRCGPPRRCSAGH